MRRGRTSPSAPNALRRPEKAANTLNRGSLTALLQLTMAFAACREWLHSAVFRPEMQLMQLLQLFAYKKTERHPGDTWGNHRPPCLHRKEIANDYINYINYIYCLKMASFRRFRAFPLTAIRTAATAFLQLTSSSRSRGTQIAFTLVDFGHAMKADADVPSYPPRLRQPPTSQSGIYPLHRRSRMIPPFSPSDSLRTHRRRLKVFAASVAQPLHDALGITSPAGIAAMVHAEEDARAGVPDAVDADLLAHSRDHLP